MLQGGEGASSVTRFVSTLWLNGWHKRRTAENRKHERSRVGPERAVINSVETSRAFSVLEP